MKILIKHTKEILVNTAITIMFVSPFLFLGYLVYSEINGYEPPDIDVPFYYSSRNFRIPW